MKNKNKILFVISDKTTYIKRPALFFDEKVRTNLRIRSEIRRKNPEGFGILQGFISFLLIERS